MTQRSSSLGRSLGLLADLYQLTMACGYWKSGMADHEAVFHLTFRRHPFGSGFTVACGLGPAVDFLEEFCFDETDREYLQTLRGNDGKPLFEKAFLEHLGNLKLSCDIDAIPEGTVVFPDEPLLRVRGPLIECQLLETALLNIVNFQTLIATKAARVVIAAGEKPVLEFGLRRAQGIDGGLAATRAAYVGGCEGTSNTLAGKLLGIPVRGTHAHSWVMSFAAEEEAFQTYAGAMPNNCLFLVDTYDTVNGVRLAIRAGKRLREQGHEMVGIRLDSGDLASLSVKARQMLDDAGFPKAVIVASSDLDEHVIAGLNKRGAHVDVWGVGTRLATAYDEPALGGVYKLSALRKAGGTWQYKLKLSEEPAKVSNPGILGVRRFSKQGRFVADAIYNEEEAPTGSWTLVDLADPDSRYVVSPDSQPEELLKPVFRQGTSVYKSPPIEEIRAYCRQQLSRLDEGIKKLAGPSRYRVGLEEGLYNLRSSLVAKAQQLGRENASG